MIQLPRDPVEATELLTALEQKDTDNTVCQYPGCYEPRQPGTGSRPPAYCSNPAHTALTNHRARKQLRAIVAGQSTDATVKTEPPAGTLAMSSLRDVVLYNLTQFRESIDRYVTALSEMSDPDIAAAQIQAAQDRIEVRVAEAYQSVSNERSLRLAAEATRNAAQVEAQTAQEAADLAIQRLEEIEQRMEELQNETQKTINEIVESSQHNMEVTEAECDAKIEQIEEEAKQQIQEITHRANELIAKAQEAMTVAQEQAHQAQEYAHEVEADARARVAAADQLTREAQSNLERERTEVERLRQEITAMSTEARKRADSDRAELDRLRKELADTTADARKRAESDHAEMEWLRQEMATTITDLHARSDIDHAEYQETLKRERDQIDRMRTAVDDANKRVEELTTANERIWNQLLARVQMEEQQKEIDKPQE